MGCYSDGQRVCDSLNTPGVLVEHNGGFCVEWSDDHRDTMRPGWMSVDYGKVWPVRPLTKREAAIIEALGTVGAANSTYIDALTGRNGASSALSRLKESGHVERSASGEWSLVPHEGERWVRRPREGGTDPRCRDADQGHPRRGHVELGGEQMLLVPVDADIVRLTAERDAAQLASKTRGEMLDRISVAAGCGWGGALSRVEALVKERDDLLGDVEARIADLSEARQWAKLRGALLDRVAAAVGGSWEEAVAKVEAARATAIDLLNAAESVANAVASLRNVCKALGCEASDVEDVVARLVAERGNLRRELGAAEQVERALLKALADAGAALAREQAVAMVNNVRARDMRRGEG